MGIYLYKFNLYDTKLILVLFEKANLSGAFCHRCTVQWECYIKCNLNICDTVRQTQKSRPVYHVLRKKKVIMIREKIYKKILARYEYGEMNITKLNQRIDDIEVRPKRK